MYKLLVAAPLLLSAGSVNHGTINADLPPERYRKNAVAIVVFTDRAGIDAHCGKAAPPNVIIACQKSIGGYPVIIMPNACPAGEVQGYAKILCHEAAHVQGWSGDHEE